MAGTTSSFGPLFLPTDKPRPFSAETRGNHSGGCGLLHDSSEPESRRTRRPSWAPGLPSFPSSTLRRTTKRSKPEAPAKSRWAIRALTLRPGFGRLGFGSPSGFGLGRVPDQARPNHGLPTG